MVAKLNTEAGTGIRDSSGLDSVGPGVRGPKFENHDAVDRDSGDPDAEGPSARDPDAGDPDTGDQGRRTIRGTGLAGTAASDALYTGESAGTSADTGSHCIADWCCMVSVTVDKQGSQLTVLLSRLAC